MVAVHQWSTEVLHCNWMPDDPSPFVQDKAVVIEMRTGEEWPQVVNFIFLGLHYKTITSGTDNKQM
jgi:hypothetical protein